MRIAIAAVCACAITLAGCGDGSSTTDTPQPSQPRTAPRPAADLPAAPPVDVRTLAAGGGHACAIQTAGAVVCWGRNDYGQLGQTADDSVPTPVAVPSITDAVSIAAADASTCVLRADGKVACWGYNDDGQLGNGSTAHSPTPVAVSGLSGAVSVVVGGDHACALHAAGDVVCWGDNAAGELGVEDMPRSTKPLPVTGLADAVSIGVGYGNSCAVRRGGQVVCWGGAVGADDGGYAPTPTPAAGLEDGSAFDGGIVNACALRSSGGVACWGDTKFGQLGDGTIDAGNQLTPVDVIGLQNARAISVGSAHSCALRAGGLVSCWGDDEDGQLGAGEGGGVGDFTPAPTEVSRLPDVTGVAAGDYFTCALQSDGAVSCWGLNEFGQLGNGSRDSSSEPVASKATGVKLP